MSREFLPSKTLREHLIDHPRPPALGSISNPLSILREQALVHGRNRHESVAECLALMALMTRQRFIKGTELIAVVGAWSQNGVGSAKDDIQAAHCLPGPLVLNGVRLHDAASWNEVNLEKHGLKAWPLAMKLRGVFGRTDPVDRIVNQSDSLLEIIAGGRGLKQSFGYSANLLVGNLRNRSPNGIDIYEEGVRGAFENYRTAEAMACEQRLEELRTYRSRTMDADEGEKIERKSLVVEQYLQLAQSRSSTPSTITAQGFSSVVRDVVKEVSLSSIG